MTVSVKYDIELRPEASHAKTSGKAFTEEGTSTEAMTQEQN